MTLARLIAKTFQTPASDPICAPAIVPRPRPATTFGASRPPRQHYDRNRDLPLLLPLWPDELADETSEGHARIIAKLQHALRRERRNGISGHWTYNLTRHEALLTALRHERARGLPVSAKPVNSASVTLRHTRRLEPHPPAARAELLARPVGTPPSTDVFERSGAAIARPSGANSPSALPSAGSVANRAPPLTAVQPVSIAARRQAPTSRTICRSSGIEARGRSLGRLTFGRRAEATLSASSRAPFSSRAASALQRSSAPPLGSLVAAPTSPDTGPATACNGS